MAAEQVSFHSSVITEKFGLPERITLPSWSLQFPGYLGGGRFPCRKKELLFPCQEQTVFPLDPPSNQRNGGQEMERKSC